MVRCRGPFFAYFEPGSTDRYNIVCGGYNHRRRVSVWHLHRQVFLRGGGEFGTYAFDCPFWIAGYPLEGYFNVADNPPADKYKPAPLQSLFGW